MNDAQRQQVRKLRGEGYSYKKISQVLGISENTIKTFCRRKRLGGVVQQSAAVKKEGHFVFTVGCLLCRWKGEKKRDSVLTAVEINGGTVTWIGSIAKPIMNLYVHAVKKLLRHMAIKIESIVHIHAISRIDLEGLDHERDTNE